MTPSFRRFGRRLVSVCVHASARACKDFQCTLGRTTLGHGMDIVRVCVDVSAVRCASERVSIYEEKDNTLIIRRCAIDKERASKPET